MSSSIRGAIDGCGDMAQGPRGMLGQLHRRVFLRNYSALALDGGFFFGAMMFVNATTLLPVMIESLGGPNWLIAMMPVMMMVGLQVPPILTAHWIARARWYKPLLLTTGIVQRVPYLLAGLALLLLDGMPRLVIAAVALAPLLSGLAGGISVTGFFQLFMKQIPERRRSSLFAVRLLIGSLIGIAAGGIIEWTLSEFPGTTGYGILHLIAFVVLAGSWFAFAAIREQPTPSRDLGSAHLTLTDNLRGLPTLVRGDHRFALYLCVRFFRNAMSVLAAFLSVHCVYVLQASEGFVGQLVMVQAVGAIVGNLLAGYVGDKVGSKFTTVVGTVLYLGLSGWSITAVGSWEFQVIFFVFGLATAMSEVGVQALGLAVCPSGRRSTLLSLMSMVTLLGALAAVGLATVLRNYAGGFEWIAIATIVGLVLTLLCLIPIRDPRHESPLVPG